MVNPSRLFVSGLSKINNTTKGPSGPFLFYKYHMFTSHQLRQDWNKELPKYWCGGSPFNTHFLNAQSIVFPAAERFFIQAVKPFRDLTIDSTLSAEITEFVKQEVWHTYAHEQYNKWLEAQGFEATKLATVNEARFNWMKNKFSPLTQLAITVGSEHITALTGAHSLRNRTFLKSMDPHFEAIWRWHSVEEVEHKSVTIDVYRLNNGGEIRRRIAFIFATMLYVWCVGKTTIQLLHADRQLWKVKTFKDMWALFFAPKGMIRDTWTKMLSFFRKGFHPTDIDDRKLLNFRKT